MSHSPSTEHYGNNLLSSNTYRVIIITCAQYNCKHYVCQHHVHACLNSSRRCLAQPLKPQVTASKSPSKAAQDEIAIRPQSLVSRSVLRNTCMKEGNKGLIQHVQHTGCTQKKQGHRALKQAEVSQVYHRVCTARGKAAGTGISCTYCNAQAGSSEH